MYSAREAAAVLLSEIFDRGAYTSIALNKWLRDNPTDDRDRRFLTELVCGTVKAKGTLDWYLDKLVAQPLKNLDVLVRAHLRLALYQILYVDRIPDAAAVDQAAELTKKMVHNGAAGFVNGVLRNFLRQRGNYVFPEQQADRMALELWHPKFLIKKWLKYYGRENTEKLCRFNNEPAPLCFRVNTLQTDRGKLFERMKQSGLSVELSKNVADGIICTGLTSLANLYSEFKGDFYIQDESSMLVAPFADPRPGQVVLDLCAAPGGKTTHLAQLMQNKGKIVACDVYPHKLPLIEANARWLGIDIIETRLQDGRIRNDEYSNVFDVVLADAPCSGLGVLRRRAEARWRKGRDDLKLFPPLQRQILGNAAGYVKHGGTLVYSTCTLEQSENHYIVAEFLEQQKNFALVSERQILPCKDNMDGFYMAKLIRNRE